MPRAESNAGRVVDPLERAYARLGLRRGCSAAELKKTYRRLVRRWHPDLYANDPLAQAEATERMREINDAFRLIGEDAAGRARPGRSGRAAPPDPPIPPRPAPAPASAAAGPRPAGRPLDRREIDAIVGALGNEGPVHALLDWLSVTWPFALALLLVLGAPRGSRWDGTSDLRLPAALVALGLAMVARQRWFSRRDRAAKSGKR
jgi:curved DNA-binding protein CbpA